MAEKVGCPSLRPSLRTSRIVGMEQRTVLIVLFDGVQSLDVTGPAEVFTGASHAHPDTRRLVRMELDPKEIKKIKDKFELLMDAGEAEGRRNWMREHWKTVEADV